MFLDAAQLALDIVGTFLHYKTDLEFRFDYRNGAMGRRQDEMPLTMPRRVCVQMMVTGGIERYRYDSDGRVTDIIDANGTAYVHNEYDRKARVTRQTLYDGQEYVMLYNDDERTNTYLTPAGGREVRYTYDRSHQLVCTGYQDGTTQERAYDIWENIVWEKDRNGNVTRHTYDEYGHLLEEERSDGLVISYAYDTVGNCCHMWDNGGTEIYYRYDNKGNLIEETE